MGYTVKDFVESKHFPGLKLINQLGINREIMGARIIAVADSIAEMKSNDA